MFPKLGGPKTKFLPRFFSAVRRPPIRPPIRPPKKTSPDFALVRPPPSALGV